MPRRPVSVLCACLFEWRCLAWLCLSTHNCHDHDGGKRNLVLCTFVFYFTYILLPLFSLLFKCIHRYGERSPACEPDYRGHHALQPRGQRRSRRRAGPIRHAPAGTVVTFDLFFIVFIYIRVWCACLSDAHSILNFLNNLSPPGCAGADSQLFVAVALVLHVAAEVPGGARRHRHPHRRESLLPAAVAQHGH